jgi:hypothetical protein
MPAGPVAISGYAWSGYAGIAQVEACIDGGAWEPAEIVESAGPLSWCRWAAPIQLEPGPHTISARATDERGIQQPRKAIWNQKGYLMNEIQTVTIEVSER